MTAKKKPRVNLAQPIQPRTGDLEKLFSTTGDVEQSSGLTLLALRVDAIDPDPDQPRSTFSEEALRELADSIRQDGVIQPIEVTESTAGRYMIVHGERRWRAARLAGLESLPAVVRRHGYDDVTRYVRQVVENIQREDLNDVDRAAALLRLRQLMQQELDAARAERRATAPGEKSEPWDGKVTWAKVGSRLGYSRQRIHQLIQLLDLPEEIKDAVRDGVLSERETRVYQGLTVTQQRALHRARMAGEIDAGEVRAISRLLRDMPEQTVSAAIRLLRQEAEQRPAPGLLTPFPSKSGEPMDHAARGEGAIRGEDFSTESIIPARHGRPTSIERLDWVRGHLARVDRHGLSAAERQEMLRLLRLIQDDVASLTAALQGGDERREF
jgi:ParB family chromosome partitioning protein